MYPGCEAMDNIIIKPTREASACVIWLHGLGADGSDFAQIVPQLCIPDQYAIKFIFPHAPIRAVTINGGFKQRAWFDIASADRAGLQADRVGLETSSARIQAMIDTEIQEGIARDRIVLVGFSQGGAVVLHAALTVGKSLGGAMGLSTYLPMWVGAQSSYTPIFLAHGKYDPLLPYQLGLETRERLVAAGCLVDWYEYPMVHTVCAEEIHDIAAWLLQRFKKKGGE